MKNYPYLLNRNGRFYFRIGVPVHLRSALGKTELVYALKTQDLSEALSRGLRLRNVAQEAFERAEVEGCHVVPLLMQEAITSATGAKIAPKAPLPTPKAISKNTEPVSHVHKFSDVYEEYLKECEGERYKGLVKKRAIFQLWIEAQGDNDVQEIGKVQVREFKALLMKVPANMKQRYPGVPLKKLNLAKIPDHQRLSVKTVNHLMGYLRALFNWMIRNGYYENHNPFVGMALRETERAIDKRLPFSDEQLQIIFATPIFKGCKSARMHDRYLVGDLIVRDALYWIPWIALYSGARMQEICQLYTTDIRQVNGIWCFDINDSGEDKLLKNRSSRRMTPIHPKLIELGLLTHKGECEDRDEIRMFPDVNMYSDGTYSNSFSKRFNHFLVRFGAKTDKTSFHSFRHTFIDKLRNAGVDREVRQALVGHLEGNSAHDNYGSGLKVKTLYDAIKKLEYIWSA